jgi:hypothetical protein
MTASCLDLDVLHIPEFSCLEPDHRNHADNLFRTSLIPRFLKETRGIKGILIKIQLKTRQTPYKTRCLSI